MRLFLLLPLLLGLMSPAIAHNEANGGDEEHQVCVGHTCGPTDEKAAKIRAKELKEGK